MTTEDVNAVRAVLQKLAAAYVVRDASRVDAFMEECINSEPELIGIGASARGGYEWFEGRDAVREIILSDWTHWGGVTIDVEGARLTVRGDVAWFSTSGSLAQDEGLTPEKRDEVLEFFLGMMKERLEDTKQKPFDRLADATHFGMRRLYERLQGSGHTWPFVLTGTLVLEDGAWRFHTLHWSMPVE